MKKILHFLLPFFLVTLITPVFGKDITISEAEALVPTVIKRNARASLKNARNLKVVERFTKEKSGSPNFHLFNLSPTGFVIIAGDDRYNAVLAFSDESNIDLSNKEEYVGLWGTLSFHESRIEYIRANNIAATLAIQNEWKTLRSRTTNAPRRGVVVAPLTTTKWNQGQYYNSECPANDETVSTGPDGRTYCGCGPIAMAQLIKFHNSPVNGNGSNSYVDPIYGEQSADFCSTTYNWANMPDELTDYNADVAKLIYHMGVSTYTYYSTDYTETYLSYMRNAFVNYFGFDQSANWFYDSNGDFNWVARNDLDRGRPLLLSGVSVFGGAHTWVADGYGYFDASGGEGDTEYFHFNWGWGGDNNGWFLDTDESWFPRGDEPNNVEITYYFDRYVIQNLFPASEDCQAPESFYTSITQDGTTYLNVNYASGEQEISFRYRKLGTADWSETAPTTNFFQLLTGLEMAAEYEFQARRKCCPSDWSAYSESETFATAGFVPCIPLPASAMYANTTSDNATYVYTAQPNGAVENHIRYRKVGTTQWIDTENSTSYFRYLTGLEAGTEYEVQVSQLCSNGGFAEFSGSFVFTTTGESSDDSGMDGGDSGNSGDDVNPDCAAVAASGLTTSSVTDTYAYVYIPQPFGAINNQFRYKPVGTNTWAETDISTLYYRFLSDLSSGTTYEYQTRHECSASSWSAYSNSAQFTTTGESTGGGNDGGDTGDGGDDNPPSNDDCDLISGESLYISSTIANASYVYTPQPYGAVNNQFRYRPVGFTDWAMTDISTLYYRYLTDLTAGTQYEFQVRHECATDSWSGFSSSAFFTTTGGGNRINTTIIPKPLTMTALAATNPVAYGQKPFSLKVYPNPTVGPFFVKLNKELKMDSRLVILDRVGRLVKGMTIAKGQQIVDIDASEMLTGVYMIQLQTEETVVTKKFVKQ